MRLDCLQLRWAGVLDRPGETSSAWTHPAPEICHAGFASTRCQLGSRFRSRKAKGGVVESSTQETGKVTGTKDKDYNLIWFTEQCLSNALRLEQYIKDAERDGDSDVADLFRRAQEASRRGAEQGKDHLRKRFAK